MWEIFGAVAVLTLGGLSGFLISGGRISFRRAKTIERGQCPGCGVTGEANDGSVGDADLYWCKSGGCRVREYKVYPYDF